MSDKEILVEDDKSFKELQFKWRENKLTDDEKDLYIKHLTLRHIDRKKKARELQAENEQLKNHLRLGDGELCYGINDEGFRLAGNKRSVEYFEHIGREYYRLKDQYESTPERVVYWVMNKQCDGMPGTYSYFDRKENADANYKSEIWQESGESVAVKVGNDWYIKPKPRVKIKFKD